MGKLKIVPLAIALGAAWAFGVLIIGWAASFGWGSELVDVMSSLYLGYGPSFVGAVIGAIWAFVDGAIGGAIIAVVYNATTGKPQSA
jgi:hypothetical protein